MPSPDFDSSAGDTRKRGVILCSDGGGSEFGVDHSCSEIVAVVSLTGFKSALAPTVTQLVLKPPVNFMI